MFQNIKLSINQYCKTSINITFYKIFSTVLFVILFVYLVFRAVYVQPLHDELATLFHYVDYNQIFGSNVVIDANNHILNSILSKIFYSVFGDKTWAIRMPNVLSFIIFFFAIYKLSYFLKSNYIRISFLISLTCIPYFLDYFAYTRGYAMSMAFLLASLYYFTKINHQYSTKNIILISIFLILGIYANLNLLIISLLILCTIFFKEFIINFKQKEKRTILYFIIITVFFGLALYYPIWFSLLLKENGSLYYGNGEGIWQTTGASLCKLILMSNSQIIMYIILAIILFFTIHLILIFFNNNLNIVFKNNSFLFILLFFGNLVAIELMHWILQINYPEDRVGMHLFYLFFLSLFFSIQHFKYLEVISLILIFLPIISWKHFNFSSSVFSPDERMEKSDFLKFINTVKRNNSSSIYLTQQLTYAYHVRKNNSKNFFIPNIKHSESFVDEDVVISKPEILDPKCLLQYKLISYNTKTNFQLLKRKNKINWKEKLVFLDKLKYPIHTNTMYYNLTDTTWKNVKNDYLRIVIKVKVHTPTLARESLVLVVDKTEVNGQNNYNAFNLNWASGKNKFYTFTKVIDIKPKDLKNFIVYLYNPNQLNFFILKKEIKTFIKTVAKVYN